MPRRLVGHHDEGDAHVRRRRREELAKRRQTAGRGTDPDDGEACGGRARADLRGGRVSPPRRRWLTPCCRPALGTHALQPGFPKWAHFHPLSGQPTRSFAAPSSPSSRRWRGSIRSGATRLARCARGSVQAGAASSGLGKLEVCLRVSEEPPSAASHDGATPFRGPGARQALGASARSASSRIWRRRTGSCSNVETCRNAVSMPASR